jgi:Fic family protein
MDRAAFSSTQQNYIIQTLAGANAFSPPSLPPQLNIADFALELVVAGSAIAELKGAARRLSNPYMLINPLIQKEALTSSAMEGTITTIENMIIEQAKGSFFEKLISQNENAREATNYIEAVKQSVASLKDIPICHRLIQDAHKILLSGLSPARGQGKRPGDYKNSQNAIGKKGDTEHSAKYVPPPPAETIVAMDKLEQFINRDDQRPGEGLLDIALAHYQFEAIHPFLDGNGRVGRMLVTLMAMQSKLLDLPLLHVSAEIEKDKDQYLDLLFKVSTQAAWSNWIKYFLNIIKASSDAATAKVDEILQLETELKTRTSKAKKNHRFNTIIESLFEKNWITTTDAKNLCKTQFQTAQTDLEQLVELGVLEAITLNRPVTYFSPEVAAISKR